MQYALLYYDRSIQNAFKKIIKYVKKRSLHLYFDQHTTSNVYIKSIAI